MWKSREEESESLLSTQNNGGHGHPLSRDPMWKGVNEEGRKFHDLVFALLFLLMFAGMAVVASIGFAKGDPSRLVPSSQWKEVPEHVRAEYWFQDEVARTKENADVLGGAVGFALLLALVWIQLLKKFTKAFIYLTLFLGVLGMLGLGTYTVVLGFQKHQQALKIVGYISFGIAALIVIAIFFLRSRIALTAALFTECSHGVQNNPAIFLAALVVVGVLAAFSVAWTGAFVYLYSIPESDVEVEIPGVPPKFNEKLRNLMFFQVFGYFWTTAFLSAVFQVSVAGAIAQWYFSRDVHGYKGSTGSPAFKSLGRAVTKSFGSLALGALILAVFQFIDYLLQKTKKASGNNRVVSALICIIRCFLSCFEALVKFINRFAYIYIAMHGDSFCTSAKNVFHLVGRNMFSTVIIDSLSEFVLFVGKLLGTALTTGAAVAVLHALERPIAGVTISIVIVVSFAIFHFFSHIIGVGVDTVLVCYLEDLERNKESGLYVSPEVHRMLQHRVKQIQH